jgi:hypothetical protein
LFVKTSCAILCVREHTTFSESGAAAETGEAVKRRQLGRDESVTHAVLITIGVIARIGGIIGSLKPQLSNDGAVRRVEGRREFCSAQQNPSLLADLLAYPWRVRGASDLHGNSEHTPTSAA